MQQVDAAVIGGGVSGTNAAWRLAQAGRSVALFERHRNYAMEASGANAGGVRQQYRDPREVPLARLTVQLWQELSKTLGSELEYRQRGNLRIAVDEAGRQAVEKQALLDREGGLEIELLSPSEVKRLAPLENLTIAAYCPSDGGANPRRSTRAFGQAAVKAGVQAHLGVGVRRLERSGKGWRLVTDAGEWQAAQVLVAAGPWSRALLEPLGVRLPLQFFRIHMVMTEKTAPLVTQFVSTWGVARYFMQRADGAILLGSNDRVSDAPPDYRANFKEAAEFVQWWAPYCAPLTRLRLARTWAGVTDYTPDKVPILDAIPGQPGLFVAAGFTGHGFALGPATGLVMSELMLGRTPPVSLAPFTLSRF